MKKQYVMEMPEFNAITLCFKCDASTFIDYMIHSFESSSSTNDERKNVIKNLKVMRENCKNRIWVNMQLSDDRIKMAEIVERDPMFSDEDFKV